MHYVYLIKSKSYPDKIYIGYTLDCEKRIKKHNEGGSLYTARYKSWNLVMYTAFLDKGTALKFESYLKTGSGRAFLKRRFY